MPSTKDFVGISLILISLGLIPTFPLMGLTGFFDNPLDQTKQVDVPFLAEVKADIVLVFVGYAGCGSVCPVSLATLRNVYVSYIQEHSGESLEIFFLGIPIPGQTVLEGEVDLYAKHFHEDFRGYNLREVDRYQTLQKLGANFTPLLFEPQDLSHTSYIYLLQNVNGVWMLKHTYTDYPPKAALILEDLQFLEERDISMSANKRNIKLHLEN